MNPLNWSAGPFLLFYSCVALGTLVLLVFWRQNLGRGDGGANAAGLDAVQLAYLAHGSARAVDTVLVGLFEARAILRGENAPLSLAGVDAAVPGPLRGYCPQMPSSVTLESLRPLVQRRERLMRAELAELGFVPKQDPIDTFKAAATFAMFIPIILGIAKIVIGSHRGHPVGILVVLVVLTWVIGLPMVLKSPYRTQAGTAALARLRRERGRAARAPVAGEVMFAFALTGAAVLAGRSYHGFFIPKRGGGGDFGGCGGGGCGGGCGALFRPTPGGGGAPCGR